MRSHYREEYHADQTPTAVAAVRARRARFRPAPAVSHLCGQHHRNAAAVGLSCLLDEDCLYCDAAVFPVWASACRPTRRYRECHPSVRELPQAATAVHASPGCRLLQWRLAGPDSCHEISTGVRTRAALGRPVTPAVPRPLGRPPARRAGACAPPPQQAAGARIRSGPGLGTIRRKTGGHAGME